MKKSLWISALIVLWLALVISRIPAQWGLWLAQAPLQMDGVTGTIWSGRAANVVLPYQDLSYSLGKLQWRLKPWSLLTLNPCVELSSELQNQLLSGEACVGLGGSAKFSNVNVQLPAQAAELWLPVNIRGDLSFHIDQLAMSNDRVDKLQGKGSWSNARYFNSLDWINLGTIAFDFQQSPQGGVQAQVFDIEGPVQLKLLYEFTMQGTYQLNGDVILRPTAHESIAQMLSVVADELERGHYKIEWAGS